MKDYIIIISILSLSLTIGWTNEAFANDSQLLTDVVLVCASGNHEPSDCQLLRRGAETFDIPELNAMAEMLEHNTLDTGKRQSIATAEALLEYAEKQYGTQSREAVVCRRWASSVCSPMDRGKGISLVKENMAHAKARHQASPQDKDWLLLSAVTQLELLMALQQRDGDNPEIRECMIEVEKSLEPLFKEKTEFSPELVDICQFMADLQMYDTCDPNYANWLFSKAFPEGAYLETTLNEYDTFSNAEAFMQLAVDGSKALWEETDIRRVRVEMDQLLLQARNRTIEYEALHKRYEETERFLKGYLPDGHPLTIQAELQKWECDMMYGKNLSEIKDPYPLLLKIKNYYGEENEEYLAYVYSLMNLMVQKDPATARSLGQEMIRLAGKLFSEEPDTYGLYFLSLTYLQLALSTNDQDGFLDSLTDLCNFYIQKHHPSWASVSIGKRICILLIEDLQLIEDGVKYYETALDDMAQLTGKETPLYAFSFTNHALYQSYSSDPDMLLQSEENFKKAIQLNKKLNLDNSMAYNTLSELQFIAGREEEGIQTLRDGIDAVNSQTQPMTHCVMQMQLGDNLINRTLDKDEEIEAIFSKAIPFFTSHEQQVAGSFMRGYTYMANYCRWKGQYGDAEETLLRGMRRHEEFYGGYDINYMQFVTSLYNLYAYEFNDLDKAEQLLESQFQTLRQNMLPTKRHLLLDLLWNRYRLIMAKTPDDLALGMAAFEDIIEETRFQGDIAGEDISMTDSRMRTLLYEMNNIFISLGKLEREIEGLDLTEDDSEGQQVSKMIEDARKNIDNTKELFKTDILPILLELETKTRQKKDSYLNMEETYQLFSSLSDYYKAIERDTVKADAYYQELSHADNNNIKINATYRLAQSKMAQQQYRQAMELLKQLSVMNGDNPQIFSSVFEKAFFAYNLYLANYLCGNYREAIEPARNFFALQQELIEQNFDLLTQKERESFVKSGGAGSIGLQLLLSKYPEELAPEAYTAILAEKGLLLRASERVKRGISMSGNQELIAMMDSLNRLYTHFNTINLQTDLLQQDLTFNPEVIKTRQQIEALERNINRQTIRYTKGIMEPDYIRLQSVLRTGEAAVEFVVTDSLIGALILLPSGSPQYTQLTKSRDLMADYYQLDYLSMKDAIEQLYTNDRLHLYERLWKPMEPLLGGSKTVFFSPTGFLNQLAFAAIRCDDGQYLSDHYELHQMLSTGDLVDLRGNSKTTPVSSASLYGAVFYSPEQQDLAERIEKGNARPGSAEDGRGAVDDEEEKFGYLSYTLREINNISQILQQHHIKTQLLTGFEPTEHSIHAASGNSPHILHLSTHGFFVPSSRQLFENKFLARFPSTKYNSMQRSGLALVDANSTWAGETGKPEKDDGILTANEVAMLDLTNTRLAVLSACETAVGEYDNIGMEGVFGMHRGFKQAGVKSILASLWNVNDKSTALMMESFYRIWLSGQPMQAAFNEAVKELRKTYPSPFYWAPFVLMDAEN